MRNPRARPFGAPEMSHQLRRQGPRPVYLIARTLVVFICASTLDHAERPEARDTPRETCNLHDLSDSIDVLVREGRLFGEAGVLGTSDDDPLGLQLVAKRCAGDLRLRGVPAHRAAGSMTCARP